MEVYNHVEQPTPRLVRRLGEIAQLLDIVSYGPVRRRELQHEADCIAWELTNYRANDLRSDGEA